MNKQSIYNSLNSLYEILKTKDSPLLKYLSDGVNRDYIENLIQSHDLRFTDELLIYFGWKNGFSVGSGNFISMSSVTLFTLGNPLPVESCLEVYFSNCFINGFWEARYFPLFESGIGDYFLYDLDSNSPTYKMILFYSPTNPYFQGVITYADSLQSLIDSIIACYLLGIYYFEEFEGVRVFEEAPGSSFNLWKERNPKSEYWPTLESFR